MANHLSAQKRARQTERRTARNRANTSSLRTQLRDLREAIRRADPQQPLFGEVLSRYFGGTPDPATEQRL